MERNQFIAQDYLSGMTLSAVAEKYGITRQRVQQIVARMGVSRPRVKFSKKLRTYDYDAIVEYVQQNSPTLAAAARQFSCSITTVRNALTRAGVSSAPYRKFSSEALQDVITRYKAGERLVLIGKSYDVSPQYVNTLLRRAGVHAQRRIVVYQGDSATEHVG